MFDKTFFEVRLPAHIASKAREARPLSVHIKLHSGDEYTLRSIEEVSLGWMIVEACPPHAQSPDHHLDRLAVAYEDIAVVIVRTQSDSGVLEFKRTA